MLVLYYLFWQRKCFYLILCIIHIFVTCYSEACVHGKCKGSTKEIRNMFHFCEVLDFYKAKWSSIWCLTVGSDVLCWQIAGVIMDNYCRGSDKHVWFSVSTDLLIDAKRCVALYFNVLYWLVYPDYSKSFSSKFKIVLDDKEWIKQGYQLYRGHCI